MLKRRKTRKYRVNSKEVIWCCVCQTNSVVSNSDVLELVCGSCFARQVYYGDLQEEKQTVKYKTGWNLKKKYKAPDGKVYSFGKEITGDTNARDTKKLSPKTKSVPKRVSRNSKQVLPNKNKRGRKKKTK